MECPACHAERKLRHGMSVQGFQAYASLWLLCSTIAMVFALRIAAAPWLPTGEPPEYALWLLRASDAKPPPACRITVRDLSGREVVVTTSESCDGAAPRPTPAGAGAHSPERMALLRLLASGLHSLLALTVGGLATWALRNALRRTFRRRAGFAWVSRARA